MWQRMNRRRMLVWMGAGALLPRSIRAASGDGISIEAGPASARAMDKGVEFAAVHYSPQLSRPYVAPLASPDGVRLSRAIPPADGEATDHPWHRGLWWGHGDINGVDFWREQQGSAPADRFGKIVLVSQPKVSGSTITLPLALRRADGRDIGAVTEEFRFSRSGELRMLDVALTLIADRMDLVMGDTDDGGLAIRLTEKFREDRGAILRSSTGAEGSKALWGKPAQWIDYSCNLGSGMKGIAILDHPSNPRHPTRWHARPYGLNSANPFAEGSFAGKASPGPAYTIRSGERLRFRYRVITHNGNAESANIQRLYEGFANS